jgi:hypothetical protein
MTVNSLFFDRLTAVLFAVLFCIICFTFRDYGISWDENLQNHYGEAVLNYYLSGGADKDYKDIFNLYLYGGFFDSLAAFFNRFISPFSLYSTRHFLNAIVGLLGIWGTWKLTRLIAGARAAFFAALFLACLPAYYGHMFFNPKDIPFAAGVVWSFYFLMRAFRAYPDIRLHTTLKFGALLGVTLGTRIGGLLILVYVAAALGFAALRQLHVTGDLRLTIRNGLKVIWQFLIPGLLIAYALMLVFWPWALEDPLHHPLQGFREFSNFPHQVDVLLAGRTFLSTENPWYYLPLFFFVQLPEYVLALIVIGFFFIGQALPFRRTGLQKSLRWAIGLIVFAAIFPIIYVVAVHESLYDATRHYLFVLPFIAVLCGIAAEKTIIFLRGRAPLVRLVTYSAGALYLSFHVYIMIALHPYQYAYFNQTVGGLSGASGRYDTDYWATAFKEAAHKLVAYVKTRDGERTSERYYRVAVCGPWEAAQLELPPYFEVIDSTEPAEFYIATTRWDCDTQRGGKVVATVERLGARLAVVQDLYDLDHQGPEDRTKVPGGGVYGEWIIQSYDRPKDAALSEDDAEILVGQPAVFSPMQGQFGDRFCESPTYSQNPLPKTTAGDFMEEIRMTCDDNVQMPILRVRTDAEISAHYKGVTFKLTREEQE